jgi:hypothetical protein
MCGNGVRCVAKYAYDHQRSRSNPMRVETLAGVKEIQLQLGSDGKVASATVDMGQPILDPPQVPVIPAEPNRPLLVSIVLLAGLVAGIATPIVMAQLDRSFATLTQLRDLGIPVLGSVTRLSLGPARRQATIQLAGVCASAGVLIAVYGTLLALSLGLHSVGVS